CCSCRYNSKRRGQRRTCSARCPRHNMHADGWIIRASCLVPSGGIMEPGNELVYIVDDDEKVGEALSTLLRANGKRVKIFTSGRAFVEFARQDSCGCLILDLRMPGLSGLEVQRLISARSSIPVIFLTGRGDIPSTVKAMKRGAVDFLTKPVEEEELL